jgi:intein/homing endonuclease
MSKLTILTKIKPRYLPEIWLTPDHMILVAAGTWRGCGKHKWKPAELIKEPYRKGISVYYDHVVIPKVTETRVPILDFRPFVKRATRLKKWAKEPTELTETMAEFFGWYVAEGSISSTAVQFSLGTENEVDRVKELIEFMGMRSWISRLKGQNGYLVVAPSRVLARACEAWFGRGAKNKKIPRFLLEAPPRLIRAFLQGYINGDGCERISRKSEIVEISSVSKILIIQIQFLLMRLGLIASYHKQKPQTTIQGRKVNSSPIRLLMLTKYPKYKFYREDKKFYYLPVERIEKFIYYRSAHGFENSKSSYFVPFIVQGLDSKNSLTDNFSALNSTTNAIITKFYSNESQIQNNPSQRGERDV